MMKKIKLFILAAVALTFSAQAQELPEPSPYAEVMQRIGLTDVTIEYSRPGVKGREIFDGLLKKTKIWRTGANASTKITFSTDAKLGDKEIKAGTYSVFTKLGRNNAWELILNKDVDASEGSYDISKDAARIELDVEEVDETVETLLFTFNNVKTNQADLTFEWENAKWTLPIKVESKKQAMENIKKKMSEAGVGVGAYNSSARYYLDNNIDIDQALEWSKKSVDISEYFWNTLTLSKIYAAKGDKKNAIKMAEKSMKLAEKADNDAYVEMNEENIEKWSE